MSKLKFIDACIEGEVLIDEIDDYIDEWHDGDFPEEIYEFLGMTQEEYRLWAEDDNVLKYIIKCHMDNKDISDILIEEGYGSAKLVARSETAEEGKFIYKWLVKNGKIKE